MNTSILPQTREARNTHEAYPPCFLGFGTLEAFAKAIPPHQPIYASLSARPLPSSPFQVCRLTINVAHRDRDGVIHYWQARVGQFSALDKEEQRQTQQKAHDAYTRIICWLEMVGYTVIEAQFATPNDWTFFEGTSECLKPTPCEGHDDANLSRH